ncbi:hypothetical protein ACFFX0_10795 [Citricoccus parietis]|uniref:Uncharacterized protein n=1 Tax=Citricoccus parietis TaxID=592307 RepID=A0ABV5FY95_9MICC
MVIFLCSNRLADRLASMSRSWAGPPPRRGPLVGVGIGVSPQMDPDGCRPSGHYWWWYSE